MTILANNARAIVSFEAAQEMPLAGHYRIYRDDGRGGQIDYSRPVNAAPILAHPQAAGKAGAGRGTDGGGFDGAGDGGGMGDGRGMAGGGPDGLGAPLLRAITPPLRDGTYRLAVVGFDAAGNEGPAPEEGSASVTLLGSPRPPRNLTLGAYDAEADELHATLGLSPDDEG